MRKEGRKISDFNVKLHDAKKKKWGKIYTKMLTVLSAF